MKSSDRFAKNSGATLKKTFSHPFPTTKTSPFTHWITSTLAPFDVALPKRMVSVKARPSCTIKRAFPECEKEIESTVFILWESGCPTHPQVFNCFDFQRIIGACGIFNHRQNVTDTAIFQYLELHSKRLLPTPACGHLFCPPP